MLCVTALKTKPKYENMIDVDIKLSTVSFVPCPPPSVHSYARSLHVHTLHFVHIELAPLIALIRCAICRYTPCAIDFS